MAQHGSILLRSKPALALSTERKALYLVVMPSGRKVGAHYSLSEGETIKPLHMYLRRRGHTGV